MSVEETLGHGTDNPIAAGVPRAVGSLPRLVSPPRRASSVSGRRLDLLGLVLLYATSLASLAGFATFTLHPERLTRAGVSAVTYARILVLAPRVQIVLAVLVLVAFLVRHARARWLAGFVAVYLISLGAELAGTTLGVPFGPYRYTDALGAKWFAHVPALIPVSWYMMSLPSYAIAHRRFPASAARQVLLGSFILLSWDLALDPAMSFTTKHWVWGTDGLYYGMPLLNLVGWLVTGVALMAALAVMRSDRWVGSLPVGWLVAFYVGNLLLPLGMSAAAGLWPAASATLVALAGAWLVARGGSRADGSV